MNHLLLNQLEFDFRETISEIINDYPQTKHQQTENFISRENCSRIRQRTSAFDTYADTLSPILSSTEQQRRLKSPPIGVERSRDSHCAHLKSIDTSDSKTIEVNLKMLEQQVKKSRQSTKRIYMNSKIDKMLEKRADDVENALFLQQQARIQSIQAHRNHTMNNVS